MTKRILITGSGSYIGTSVEKYLSKWPVKYEVRTINTRDASWRDYSFLGFDVVFHVAGIAHSDAKQASTEVANLYYEVNTDLAGETAKKAKQEGVRQFIFMSSAIVYGHSSPMGQQKIITGSTKESPTNFYGDSKLRAEKKILELHSGCFKVCILRPPLIYGKGCKGNYPILSKCARTFPLFPKIQNERSMLYIDNFCEFVRLMIDNEEYGTFFPQNDCPVSVSAMVAAIALAHGKKVYLTNAFNPILRVLSGKLEIVDKVFGNFVYESAMSVYKENYQIVDFEQSILKTEGRPHGG